MKKIMFNDQCKLTDATVEGYKENTRRIIHDEDVNKYLSSLSKGILMVDTKLVSVDVQPKVIIPEKDCSAKFQMITTPEMIDFFIKHFAYYKVGEIVAVAQSYKTVYEQNKDFLLNQLAADGKCLSDLENHAGWRNKENVCAYYMPHQIQFTGIKIERLQDISPEDCLKEGVREYDYGFFVPGLYRPHHNDGVEMGFINPIDAFATLIDKVSRKGTWNKNPLVFAYKYKKVK